MRNVRILRCCNLNSATAVAPQQNGGSSPIHLFPPSQRLSHLPQLTSCSIFLTRVYSILKHCQKTCTFARVYTQLYDPNPSLSRHLDCCLSIRVSGQSSSDFELISDLEVLRKANEVKRASDFKLPTKHYHCVGAHVFINRK